MKVLRRTLLLVAGTLCLAAAVSAKPWWMRDAETNQNNFLPPDEAFQVSARVDGDLIRIRWVIADGYYLYRQRMEIQPESPDLMISDANFPPGTVKDDPYLGTQEIYTQQVEGTAAFTRSDAGAHPVEIRVTYQGCAEAGLCYPPINKVIFPTNDNAGATTAGATDAVGGPGAVGTTAVAAPIPVTATPDPLPAPSPGTVGPTAKTPPHPWEVYAILGGVGAFFLAGLVQRKGRRLPSPA